MDEPIAAGKGVYDDTAAACSYSLFFPIHLPFAPRTPSGCVCCCLFAFFCALRSSRDTRGRQVQGQGPSAAMPEGKEATDKEGERSGVSTTTARHESIAGAGAGGTSGRRAEDAPTPEEGSRRAAEAAAIRTRVREIAQEIENDDPKLTEIE